LAAFHYWGAILSFGYLFTGVGTFDYRSYFKNAKVERI
jgi:hypothetical protein